MKSSLDLSCQVEIHIVACATKMTYIKEEAALFEFLFVEREPHAWGGQECDFCCMLLNLLRQDSYGVRRIPILI